MTKYGFTNNNLSTSKLNVSNITRIQKLIANGFSKNKIKIVINISSSPEDSRIKLRDLQIEQLKKNKNTSNSQRLKNLIKRQNQVKQRISNKKKNNTLKNTEINSSLKSELQRLIKDPNTNRGTVETREQQEQRKVQQNKIIRSEIAVKYLDKMGNSEKEEKNIRKKIIVFIKIFKRRN